MLKEYYGKKVLLTGDTGFKGSWLGLILSMSGANVVGYALKPPTEPNLFNIIHLNKMIEHVEGDVRDYDKISKIIQEKKPEIVFHLAAQPIVRYSYENPVYTYETNVMGTVNLLEGIRKSTSVKSVLNVTTDKVYKNREWEWGYRENEELDGFDPYSNSKSCSELVTHSYKAAFFDNMDIGVSTARAGNVIGGGDFARDRILPDCMRAAQQKKDIILRNPHSTRPYQHVLEPLSAYLKIAQRQVEDKSIQGYYNVGPNEEDCVTTGNVAEIFCKYWGEGLKYTVEKNDGPHEANFLKLDCSKIKKDLNWMPRWDIDKAIEKTVEWDKVYLRGEDVLRCMENQIEEFFTEKL